MQAGWGAWQLKCHTAKCRVCELRMVKTCGSNEDAVSEQ